MLKQLPLIAGVHFEQDPERLKIVLPAKRKWLLLGIYSLLVLVWLGMLIAGVVFLARILFSGESYRITFAVMILLFLLILYWFGRKVASQWMDYLSNREVLFFNREELILRRPVSILGNTYVYDRSHVQKLYRSETPRALAFDYGYRHIYFGEALSQEAGDTLLSYLNSRYFQKTDPEQ